MTHRAQPNVCIVLLAAGAATRFGSAKQIADIDGVAMVRHCALNAMTTDSPTIVVTGAYRDDVERALRDLDLTIIHNADWANGLGSSIARGIDAVVKNPDVSAAIILLGDQPLITGDDLRELIALHRANPDRIVAASADGIITPPCLFPRRFFSELQDLPNSTGARALIDRHRDQVISVHMPNAAVDIDTTDAYAQFCASRRS